MKSTITSQEKNPLLNREEFILTIESEITPSEADIIADLGKDPELTIVNKVNTRFGKKVFVVDIVVYDSLDDKKKNHLIPQKIRKKMAAEEKARIEAEKKAKADAEKKKAEEEAAAKEAAKAAETATSDEAKTEEKTSEEATA